MNKKIKNKVLTVDPNLSFEDIVKKIDTNGDGFLALVDDREHLVGVVTDGDIRRAFLRKEFNTDKIINKKPMTLPAGTSKEKVIGELKARKRRHMPLVDAQGVLSDIITLDEVDFEIRNQLVIIMAGGMGKRLGDLTRDLPKPMLLVGDKPILEHILANFKSYGFRKFALAVNYKSEIIKNHFKNGGDHGVEISYIEESQPLGTAGAISLIEQNLITDEVIIINGDVLTNTNLADLLNYHQSCKADITICSKEMNVSVPYAVLELNEKSELKSFKEKPKFDFWINSGIYILNKEMANLIPKNTFFNMTELIEKAISMKKLVKGYKTKEYWVDIGQVQDYEKAKQDF